MSIGREEALEVVDLQLQLFAAIGVANVDAIVLEVLKLYVRMHIDAFDDGFLLRLEMIVLDQLEAVAVEDERIAGDAGGGVVGLGESAVDDETDAFGTDGRLALVGAYGHMTVDDMGAVLVEAEFAEDGLANLLAVGEFEEGTLLLLVEVLVADEVTLEGGHLVLVEEG